MGQYTSWEKIPSSPFPKVEAKKFDRAWARAKRKAGKLEGGYSKYTSNLRKFLLKELWLEGFEGWSPLDSVLKSLREREQSALREIAEMRETINNLGSQIEERSRTSDILRDRITRAQIREETLFRLLAKSVNVESEHRLGTNACFLIPREAIHERGEVNQEEARGSSPREKRFVTKKFTAPHSDANPF